ncbi:hypothetical protein X975_03032, partial [Stegodyphus mimosarum]
MLGIEQVQCVQTISSEEQSLSYLKHPKHKFAHHCILLQLFCDHVLSKLLKCNELELCCPIKLWVQLTDLKQSFLQLVTHISSLFTFEQHKSHTLTSDNICLQT